ncbi:MAG: hypothetical protein JWM19_940 [Actinomycetia bacterium]|nr:hypothetical protein [Actinomycetes bacterium]
MIRKHATLQVLESWRVPAQAGPAVIRKAAHRVAFDYEPRPGYLYVRSRMISSRTNDNHDTFPAGEIAKGYKTFLGKPVFVNHHNANHRRARGVIVAVALHRDRNADGTPDTWAEGLMEVDAVRFPKLAAAIIARRVNRTSMGVDVEWSRCSACGNKATSPAEYCRHLPAMKGKKIRKTNPDTGKVEEKLIHEVCAGLSFFENSLLVEDPADPSAYVLGDVDTRGLAKAASRRTASSWSVYPGACPSCGSGRHGDAEHLDAAGYPMRQCKDCGTEYGAGGPEYIAEDPPIQGRMPDRMTRFDPGEPPSGVHLSRRRRRTAAVGPDFRDHIGNRCLDCGQPVHFARGLEVKGRYPWQHRHQSIVDHQAAPSDPSDKRPSQNMTYGGTHCAICHDPVKINLNALDVDGGGWHHGDGMKRDHPALPADPQAVYDAIPGVRARFEQARAQMRDHMHSQFEQMSGHPLPQRPRGDEDQMPPDPFTAAKKKEGGDHPFFHKNPVSKDNIVASYGEATDDEKSLGDRWYADAHHVAKGITGGNAATGAGLLSAYSPRTAWPVNMFNASRAAQGDPPGPGTGAMGSHQKAAMRILAGEHHTKVLKAPKTAAFAHLIEHGGDTPEDEKHGKGKVVIDRHAMSVAMGRRISDDDDAPLDQHQHYEHVAQLYRDAAHDLSKATGRKISPHQVQATTWLRQIRKNNEDDAGATGAKGAAGKGRAAKDRNARERWREHHPHAHPGEIPEHNMHHRGQRTAAWTENPPYCSNCRSEFGYGATRSSDYPFLCADCAGSNHQGWGDGPSKHILDPEAPDINAQPSSPRDAYEIVHGLAGRSRPYGEGDFLTRSTSSRKLAYGETRVPPQVDTLRMEECPVCGEHDVWSGDRCPVCGFVVPPSLFRDPDTSKAQQVRDQLDQEGEVTTPGDGMQPTAPGTGPDGQVGSGEDASDQLLHPDQVAPDGVPTVQGGGGPLPGPETDGQPPTGEDGQPGDGEEEQAEGQQLEEQGQEEIEQGQEDDAQGQELEQQGEQDDLEPAEQEDDLECPACGSQFATDGAAQPGVPCPSCKMAALVPLEAPGGPGLPPEGAGDPSESGEDEGEEKMPPGSKTAAALAQAQASRMATLAVENEVLREQLHFLASAAGADQHLARIRNEVLRRRADILNPASPVPDPPEAPPTQTTEEALMSGGAGSGGTWPRGTGHTTDDPSRPGATPGSMANVPAAQTTTSITPGVEMQTAPATNLIDVTAPVQGTNPSQDGGVPLEQRRIETDVRVNPNPLAAEGPGIGGLGDNGAAFPWLLDSRQPQGQQGQQRQAGRDSSAAVAAYGEAVTANRTFASIRLAKLRIATGSAQGDELSVAERIERDAALPTSLIEHEISVLAGLRPVATQQRPMQRAGSRQAPSLAAVGAMSYAPAAMAGDDFDASDLFD